MTEGWDLKTGAGGAAACVKIVWAGVTGAPCKKVKAGFEPLPTGLSARGIQPTSGMSLALCAVGFGCLLFDLTCTN